MYQAEIPLKLLSLNDYTRLCRANKYAAAEKKRSIEKEIGYYLRGLPKLEQVNITFTWQEGNKRRDYDNVAFAKKFILDALVKSGKLKDDNRKCVVGFTDRFVYAKEFAVYLDIEEVES
jgi:Holliday junction resolvase RusA-like endonuclease